MLEPGFEAELDLARVGEMQGAEFRLDLLGDGAITNAQKSVDVWPRTVMTPRMVEPLPILRFRRARAGARVHVRRDQALVRLERGRVSADTTRLVCAKLEVVDAKLRDLRALRRTLACLATTRPATRLRRAGQTGR